MGVGDRGDRPAVIILDLKSARALHPGQDIESLFRMQRKRTGPGSRVSSPVLSLVVLDQALFFSLGLFPQM